MRFKLEPQHLHTYGFSTSPRLPEDQQLGWVGVARIGDCVRLAHLYHYPKKYRPSDAGKYIHVHTHKAVFTDPPHLWGLATEHQHIHTEPVPTKVLHMLQAVLGLPVGPVSPAETELLRQLATGPQWDTVRGAAYAKEGPLELPRNPHSFTWQEPWRDAWVPTTKDISYDMPDTMVRALQPIPIAPVIALDM